MGEEKRPTFEIMFFSMPTEDHFKYFWSEAQKYRIGQDRFMTLWFEAYNKFTQRLAEDQLSKRRYELAEILINKGRDIKTRNAGRTFLNKALKSLGKAYGVDLDPMKLETEASDGGGEDTN